MNKTKQEKWQRAYGDTPDSFRQRVAASLPKGEESRHVAFPRRAMVLAAALVLVQRSSRTRNWSGTRGIPSRTKRMTAWAC